MNLINVGLVSLGCDKNRVDAEIMLGLLKNNGFNIVSNPDIADIIIVNTCGFIDSAKEEAINTILEMAEYKNKNCKALIVTGCLAQRYSTEIIKEMPEVDAVLGTGNYSDIVKIAKDLYGKSLAANGAENNKPVLCTLPDSVDYLNNERLLSTPQTYAYIKIAEGCNNCCTYCVIPSLRGSLKSRPKEDIIKEACELLDMDVKELILVAQDTTKYGIDLYGKPELVSLLTELSNLAGDFRIRILYSYPQNLSDELIDLIASNDKICKYIDMPIQHASDRILKLMGRKDKAEEIKKLVVKLRERIQEIFLRTTVIVGFPGESEEDFSCLKEFIKDCKFDRLGVFTYSREEGTPAANMPGQVTERVKKRRRNDIMEIQQQISIDSNIKRLNREYDCIVEGIAEDGIFYYGRTYAETPDVDGLVYFTSPEPIETGGIIKVKMLNYDEYDMIGEALI